MLDISKQVEYWRSGATEEWEFAAHLLDEKRYRHGLFFLHLAVEKLLKAHVSRKTGDIPPRTHSLRWLSELAGIDFSEQDRAFLAELSIFNIEGRYPDSYEALPTGEEMQRIRLETERVYLWLLNQL